MPSRTVDQDALETYLQFKGLKWTRQREAILEVFLATDDHLTSEEIYQKVVRKNPKIGFSTVYRTLRLFVDAGIASERHFQDGVTRYEVRQPHHDHLVCLSCGKILEFEHEGIEALQEEIASEQGFELVSHRHELYGRCGDCRTA